MSKIPEFGNVSPIKIKATTEQHHFPSITLILAYIDSKTTLISYTIMSQNSSNHSGNAVYGLGFIGAAIYFISSASSFGAGAIGFLKALAWPAFLVYEVLKHLGA